MTQHITMGAGLTAPEGTFATGADATGTSPSAAAGRPTFARRLLGATAVAAPARFAAYVATDPAPLPREPAPDFIGAIAAHPTAFVVSTSLQFAAMATGVALAAYVMIAFARKAPRLAPVVGVLLGLGYLGGAAFAGAKTIAADLVVDGVGVGVGVDIWAARHSGPPFEVMSLPTGMAGDTVVVCAGQESVRGLYDDLGRGHLIGGADVAAELDAKRAIDQGTRVVAAL